MIGRWFWKSAELDKGNENILICNAIERFDFIIILAGLGLM